MPPSLPATASAEKHWTIPQLAKTTGVSASTWRRAIDAGDLPYLDVAQSGEKRQPRIADTQVRRWLADRTIPARRSA